MKRRHTTARKHALIADLAAVMPRDADQLHQFVRKVLKLNIPRQAIVPGHNAPFDYLQHVFFEGQVPADPQSGPHQVRTSTTRGTSPDCLVWASRGGGKTMLGAAATLLDLLFKPGIQIRILGGSLGQSSKMFDYLCAMFDDSWLRPLLAGEPTRRRLALRQDSVVELLAQSHTSVRGTRVHKLRCDEVEEFDPEVWAAAQMVTHSGRCGSWRVRGSVEALSTMHRPHGLMSQLTAADNPDAAPARRLFRWSALDVVQRCEPLRRCNDCLLWEDCRGLAKEAGGFLPVEDLVQQRKRVSRQVWEAEMMCHRPSMTAAVYPNFDPPRHVTPLDLAQGSKHWLAGMDFGMRNPTVFLWARVQVLTGRPPMDWPLEIVDEHHACNLTLEQTLAALEKRPWPKPQWVGVDPAGHQRSAQTGLSEVQCLQRRGYVIRSRPATVAQGIERLRSRLDHDLLRIDPRCSQLIQALTTYHFDLQHPQREEPVKDGPDHACDALRYLIMNLEHPASVVQKKSYW